MIQRRKEKEREKYGYRFNQCSKCHKILASVYSDYLITFVVERAEVCDCARRVANSMRREIVFFVIDICASLFFFFLFSFYFADIVILGAAATREMIHGDDELREGKS